MNVVYSFLAAAFELFELVCNLLIWMLVIGAVMSWLEAFEIINTRNRLIQVVSDFVYRVTEPLLRPIRKLIPPMGGIDLSPVVLVFGILFLQSFFRHLLAA